MEYRIYAGTYAVRMKMVFSDTGWMETAKYWKGTGSSGYFKPIVSGPFAEQDHDVCSDGGYGVSWERGGEAFAP